MTIFFLWQGQTNDTCDIDRAGGAAGPRGVSCYVIPRWKNIKGNWGQLFSYTHAIYLPLGTDVRDSWTGANGSGGDTIYLPNKAGYGISMVVAFVARERVGGGNDYLVAYCQQNLVNYPTTEG
jgi:hypothetical protein